MLIIMYPNSLVIMCLSVPLHCLERLVSKITCYVLYEMLR